MTGLSLLLVAAATAADFGWQPQPDGNLEYVIQIAPSQVELLKSGQIVINDIPPDVRGGRSIVLKVGAGDVPRQGRVAPPAGAGLGQGAGLIGRTAAPSTARQAPRFAPVGGGLPLEPAPNFGNPPPFQAQPAGANDPLQPIANPAVAPAPALLPANAAAAPQGQFQPNEALRAPELAAPLAPANPPLQPIPQPQFAQPNPALQPNPAVQPFAQPNAAPQLNLPPPPNLAQPGRNVAPAAWPNPAQPNIAQPNLGQPNFGQHIPAQPNLLEAPANNFAAPNLAAPNFAQPNFGQPNFAQPNPAAAPPAPVADPRWNDPRVNLAPALPALVSRPGDQVPGANAPVAGPWPAFPQGAPPRDDSPLLVPVNQNPVAAPTRPPQVDVRPQPWEPVAQDPRLAQPGIGPDPRFDPIQPRIDPWQRRWDNAPADENDNFNGPIRNDVADRADADARWANARWDGSRWTSPRSRDNPLRDTSFRSRNGGQNGNPRGNLNDDERFADRADRGPADRGQVDPNDRWQNDPNDRWRDDPNDRWQGDPKERFNTIPVGYAPSPASGLGVGAFDALKHDRNATGTMLSTGKVPVSSTPSKLAATAAALDARDQSWMPWTITTLGLFLSIGANLYLWWIWSDAHRRYLMLIAEMRGARS